jgi:ABC-type phosphate transport system permease subunit
MREYRNEVGQGVMSYGRALGTGTLISVWAALFNVVFTIVYFKIINPGFTEAIVQFQMAEMEKKGIPAATIEQSEGVLRFMSGALMLTIMATIMSVILGIILSLILAAIFKSKPGQSAPPPVAA